MALRQTAFAKFAARAVTVGAISFVASFALNINIGVAISLVCASWAVLIGCSTCMKRA